MSTLFYSFSEGLRSLKISPVQTFFSILGIIIGVASLVAILGLGDGLETYSRKQVFETTSIHSLSLVSETRLSKNGILYRNPNIPILLPRHKKELLTRLDTGITVQFYFNHAVQLQKLNDTLAIVGFVTALESLKDVRLPVRSGASELKPQGVWVTSNLIDQLEKAGLDTQSVWLLGQKKSILGVFEDEKVSRVWVNPTEIPDSLFAIDPPTFVFTVTTVEQAKPLKDSIYAWTKTTFPSNHQYLKVQSYEGRLVQLERAILIFKLVMGLITGISVLVGGIGVMNVMLMSIKERTPEIGVRKAVGAQRKQIVVQFLAESVTVSVIGSFIGLIFAIVFMEALVPIIKATTEIDFPLAWTISTLFIVSGLAVVIGIVFGTYPAYKASRLDPIEAIQRV